MASLRAYSVKFVLPRKSKLHKKFIVDHNTRPKDCPINKSLDQRTVWLTDCRTRALRNKCNSSEGNLILKQTHVKPDKVNSFEIARLTGHKLANST